jgi:BolA protein
MKDRIQLMTQKLTDALSPTHLEVIDDSAQHAGHEGSRGGAGHYTVVIRSPFFQGKTKIQIHQMVYGALEGWIGPEIHALRIQASA